MESFFADIWETAKQAGPFATMVVLYFLYNERKERLDHQNARLEYIERMTRALENSTITNVSMMETIREGTKLTDTVCKTIVIQTEEISTLNDQMDKFFK